MLKRLICTLIIFFVDIFVLGIIPGSPFWEVFILLFVDLLLSKIFKVVISNEK